MTALIDSRITSSIEVVISIRLICGSRVVAGSTEIVYASCIKCTHKVHLTDLQNECLRSKTLCLKCRRFLVPRTASIFSTIIEGEVVDDKIACPRVPKYTTIVRRLVHVVRTYSPPSQRRSTWSGVIRALYP